MSLKNLFVVACLCVVTMMFFGCVDLPSDAPQFPDFRTQTRFIQSDAALGAAQILVDGTAQGTVDFGSASSYMDLPSGNRSVQVQGDADQAAVALESDANVTVVVFPKESASAARFKLYKEKQTFAVRPDTVGLVRFISAGTDTGGVGVSYDILNTSDLSVVASGLTIRANSGYVGLPAGSYTFGVAVEGTEDVIATSDVSVSNGQSYTAVIFGDQTSLSLKAFQDQ